MTRLIDADALLEALLKTERLEPIEGFNGWDNQPDAEGCLVWFDSIFHLIYNAPTVQREGWVSVPIEPTEEMLMAGCEAGLDIKTLMDDELFATDKAVYKAMIKPYINK